MNSKILLLVLLTIFVRAEVYAQCTTPPDCIYNPGIDGSLLSWGDPIGTSLPDWYVLSGTPILAQGVVSSSGFKIINGEGMYTCYKFKTGRTYKICLRAYTTNGQDGFITLQAHDGGAGSQTIGTIQVTQHGLQPADYSTTFTAISTFTQLRILVNNINTSVVIDDVGIIEVPTITASPSTIDVCGNTILTINSANPLNVVWSPSTGLSSTHGTVVTARPCKTTTYTATYSTGCSLFTCKTGTVQVTVYVQKNGSIINTSSLLCGGPIDLKYSPNTPCPGSTYKWYGLKNPTSLLSTSANLSIPSSTPGDQGSYLLEVTTPQGCKDSLYEPVVMNCCKVIADFDIIGCNPVRFKNSTLDSIGGDTILQGEWYWDFGDGTTSTLRNPSNLYTQLGNTTVCLTAVIFDGFSTCCGKICKDVDVCDWGPDCLKAAFDYKVINQAIGDVQFLDKSVGGFYACGWTWKVNGTPVASTQNPTINLGTPGPPGTIFNICLETLYCMPNGSTCSEEWCENIVFP